MKKKGIIIGGGIAGLTAAIAMEQQGMEVLVYEAAPELKPYGAGIWMAPNAMQVFDRLGVKEAVLAEGISLEKVDITDENLNRIHSLDLQKIQKRFGSSIAAIHRARLQKVLYSFTNQKKVFLNKVLKHIEDNKDKVIVHFEDGTSEKADFVIGADGQNSKVRQVLHPQIPLRYSGQTCWRGLVTHKLSDQWKNATLELWGDQLRFGMAEMADEQIYWFAVKSDRPNQKDQVEDIKKELSRLFKDFDGPVQELIQATPSHMIRRTDLYDLPGVKNWHRANVCLIGDAAHAATPNLGQGGAQAVEDAYTLVQCLAQEKNHQEAFRNFQKRRYGKVQKIIHGSYWIGKVAHWKYFQGLRNFVLRNTPSFFEEQQLNSIYRIDS